MIDIKAIRARIEGALDYAQAKAEAAEAQIALGNTEVKTRFQDQYQQLVALAGDLLAKLEAAGLSAGEAKTQLQGAMVRLEVQLSLGTMDSSDALEALKKDIEDRNAVFNAALDAIETIDNATSEEIEAAMDAYMHQASNLGAELDARAKHLEK